MLGWICEKMVIQELALGGGRFSASGSTAVGNNASACNDPCALGGDCSTAARNDFWDNAHTFDSSSRGEGWAENQVLWCNTHNIRVEVQMAKLARL
jgi:hypothetical protein